MRKFGLLMISVAGMVVAGSAALADDPAPAPAPAATTAPAQQADLDKMVCRTMAPATGTRIGARRECRTQREWDDIRAQAQKETNRMEGPQFTTNPTGH